MLNKNFQDLEDNYLFAMVAEKSAAYIASNPDKPIIRMGIGDVTKPLAPAVVQALHDAAEDMGNVETFHGYGPEQGYGFLRESIVSYYESFGVKLDADEIFVSDGAKNDIANILDLFSKDAKVLIPDPVYPVYLDTNVMDGREVVFADANEENAFLPMPDDSLDVDLIYICSPNNPTGACYSKEALENWVAYANEKNAIILYDAAYEAFIVDESPRSIYAVKGAETCAIEIASLSKTAGFTGLRCSHSVVPKALERKGISLRDMWNRRQSTKFNGTPYIVQKAAEAVYSPQGMKEISANIEDYQENAKIMTDSLDALGLFYTGGKNSPYIWFKCPNNMDSWEFFDKLLEEVQVVGTPGAGFGKNGKNFFRLTAFNTKENTEEAMRRLEKLVRSL